MSTKGRILVVDDEESIRKLLKTRFEREGWAVETADNGNQAVEKVGGFDPQTVVTDIKMPGLDGFQLIDALRDRSIACPVIVITGHGEKDAAIESMHKGAFDYIEKPFDTDEISLVVKRALDRESLRRDNLKLVQDLEEANKRLSQDLEVKSELLERTEEALTDDLLVGKSDHVQELKKMIKHVSQSFRGGDNDPVVLIVGESGTGKEVVARYMHQTIFNKDKPFVAVNCAAFPEHLLESELFGYEKGAFTGASSRKLGLFELAAGGTIFLDEIGEMDPKMQAKLLRVLQERVVRRVGGTSDTPVKAHIMAATNRDLAKSVEEKTFREDLYYRLNTIPISIAPLRSRKEDIDVLARHFLKMLGKGRGKKLSGFSRSALKALETYTWPGNVRELRSVVERAIILEEGPTLELSFLRRETMQNAKSEVATVEHLGAKTSGGNGNVVSFPQLFQIGLTALRKEMDEKFVRQVLIQSLSRESGNVSAVARSLKLDRANLLRMLKRYAIQPDVFRGDKEGEHRKAS